MIRILFHNLPDDTRYSFAVGKIRALESKMLNYPIITRMLKASGADEMLKILMDTGYGHGLNGIADGPFESILDQELQALYQLIHSIDPDPQWTDLWRWRYDAHNIKILLKAGISHPEIPGYLITYSVIEPQRLIGMFQEKGIAPLAWPLKEAIEWILSQKDEEREKTAKDLDFIIDNALYKYFISEAKVSNNIFILHLIKMLIDFLNIMGYMRSRRTEVSNDFMNRAFVPGGSIPKEGFSAPGDKDTSELITDLIRKSPYKELLPAVNAQKLFLLETAMDNFLITYLRQTRLRAFGVEPLIGYLLAKELEIKNLRLLYIGKANGLEEGIIKERLRDSYV